MDIYNDCSECQHKVNVKEILAQMSLEEKVAQMTGLMGNQFVDENTGKWKGDEHAADLLRNGIGFVTYLAGGTILTPSQIGEIYNRIQTINLQHARHPLPILVREECISGFMARGATIFPQNINVASTWNPPILEQMTKEISNQMHAVGAFYAIAPNLDIARDPRWGRVEETYGEDPYLTSCFGYAFLKGFQNNALYPHIACCAKHFVAHGIPQGGSNWGPVQVGNRELRDVFALPFEVIIQKTNVHCIMAAYHEIDGIPVHSSKRILQKLLKEDLGFTGTISSDGTGIVSLKNYHHVAKSNQEAATLAIQAGIHIEAPFGECYRKALIRAVKRGEIHEDQINTLVLELLEMKKNLGVFEKALIDENAIGGIFNNSRPEELSRKIAGQSITLLQNNDDILPLSTESKTIALIGPHINSIRGFLGDYTHPGHRQDVHPSDSQNKHGVVKEISKKIMDQYNLSGNTLTQALKKEFPKCTILSTVGCDVNTQDTSRFSRAVEIAQQADYVILALGGLSGIGKECTCGEMRDRTQICLPGVQEELLMRLSRLSKPIILILFNGRQLALSSLLPYLDALIEAWLPGPYGGDVIAEILSGKLNPSGHLPVSFPRNLGQVPIYYNRKPSANHPMFYGKYVNTDTDPLFPFGYGLSYTKFRLSHLQIDPKRPNTNSEFLISCQIQNIGDRYGETVVQLYIHDEEGSVTRPVQELKGFIRVRMKAHEKKMITFHIPAGHFGFYNRNLEYTVEPGTFVIMLGKNCRDIELKHKIRMKGKPLTFESREFFTSEKIR